MENKSVIKTIVTPFIRFSRIEAAGGIILLSTTVIALIWANSPFRETYFALWENKLTIGLGSFMLSKDLHHWINDGLMAIFFFVVGLEIKREIMAGELSSMRKATLPIFAAIGGMLVPAVFYTVLNSNPDTASGWGVPMATDIAFSLGILSLFGKRVPLALKVFLVAFAIVDDLGAVLVIALFYSHDTQTNYLLYGLGLFLLLIILNRLKITKDQPYMIIGWVIWYFFLKSGIHPTIAGVLIAFTIPVSRKTVLPRFKQNMDRHLSEFCDAGQAGKIALKHEHLNAIDNMHYELRAVQAPAHKLEHNLHSFVTFFVMPVFALANAGVSFEGTGAAQLFSSVSLNIELSLFFGKLIGIVLFAFIAIKFKMADMPANVNWAQITGVALLGGIGFTMSLFISGLAFEDPHYLNLAKMGILLGSLLSGVIGYLLLNKSLPDSAE